MLHLKSLFLWSCALVCLCLIRETHSQTCKYAMYQLPGQTHTGCLPPNTSCMITNSGVNDRDKELIVRLHNQIRSRTAQGKQMGAPGVTLPQASDMRQLEWDDELAQLAQKHTDQCRLEFDCFNCRKVEDFSTGEVIYYMPDGGQFQRANWTQVIVNLAKSSNQLRSVKANSFTVTAFTQIIWGLTRAVGCGFTRFKSGPAKFMNFFTCLYGPAGNYIEMNIYETGAPCLDCSFKNTCCDSTCARVDYTGLCKLNN